MGVKGRSYEKGRPFSLQILAVIQEVQFLRHKKKSLLILSVLPLFIHLALSVLKLYPFDPRLILYLLPAITILAIQSLESLILVATPKLGIRKFTLLLLVLLIEILVKLIQSFSINNEEALFLKMLSTENFQILKEHRDVNTSLYLIQKLP